MLKAERVTSSGADDPQAGGGRRTTFLLLDVNADDGDRQTEIGTVTFSGAGEEVEWESFDAQFQRLGSGVLDRDTPLSADLAIRTWIASGNFG